MPSLPSMVLSLALLIVSLNGTGTCCCSAFVPPSQRSQQQQQQQSGPTNKGTTNGRPRRLPQQNSSELSVGISFDEGPTVADDDGMDTDVDDGRYRRLLSRVSDCAGDGGEGCPTEEWDSILRDIELVSGDDVAEGDAEAASELLRHQRLEGRRSSSVAEGGLWSSRAFARDNLPVFVASFLASTYGTVAAVHDDVVTRVGWYVQDWDRLASTTAGHHSPPPLPVACAVAACVALSEVISGYLPKE